MPDLQYPILSFGSFTNGRTDRLEENPMSDIDPRWLKQAEEDLPCDYKCSHRTTVPEHSIGCPAYYRPAVAQALQEAYLRGLEDNAWNYPAGKKKEKP